MPDWPNAQSSPSIPAPASLRRGRIERAAQIRPSPAAPFPSRTRSAIGRLRPRAAKASSAGKWCDRAKHAPAPRATFAPPAPRQEFCAAARAPCRDWDDRRERPPRRTGRTAIRYEQVRLTAASHEFTARKRRIVRIMHQCTRPARALRGVIPGREKRPGMPRRSSPSARW